MRPILLLTIVSAVVAAGCAQSGDPSGGGSLVAPSNADAAALFAQAASDLPDQYGVTMKVTKEATELMSAEAVFDEPRETGWFTIRMDPSVAQDEGGMGMSFPEEGLGMYTSPAGSAFVMGTNVIVMPPGENAFMSQAEGNEGFDALSDPDELLAEMKDSNFTVASVTTTTLRGKPALKMDGTFVEEGEAQNVTVFMFQDPTRIARVEMVAPADDEQFAGALMTMDILYEGEITAEVPEGVTRAMGLRYQSDRSAFGMGGFGGSSGGDEEGPETWTFQVDGGIALADVEAEVGEGMSEEDAAPLWTMKLSEGSKAEQGVTLTFEDVDGDGKVSMGDTLTIARGEGAEHLSVSLKDLVTGYRVTPGAGAALLALAVLAAIVLARRR